MKILLLLFPLTLTTIQAFQLKEHQEWTSFKFRFGKAYDNQNEEDYRMSIYMDNVRKIAEHNQKYERGEISYSMKMNKFGDMTDKEFQENYLSNHVNNNIFQSKIKSMPFQSDPNAQIPDSFDWREKNVVTRVKNQGNCGSCWAFGSTAAIESHLAIKTGNLTEFSEQNLVDCVGYVFGHGGCEGLNPMFAFDYVSKNGINPESVYPYEAQDGKCRYKPTQYDGHIKSFEQVTFGNEKALKEAVATKGPVTIGFHSPPHLQFYCNGIYYNPKCPQFPGNHAVLIVGYGTENGKDYWLVKNSWTDGWGLNGYIKMARNANNQCGVASLAIYPLV